MTCEDNSPAAVGHLMNGPEEMGMQSQLFQITDRRMRVCTGFVQVVNRGCGENRKKEL